MVANTKYYDTLEVNPTATAQEIKTSYRRLARIWHPDKHKNKEEADSKFKEISHAYSILGDQEKREKYDKYGDEPPPSNVNPADFMQSFFGQQREEVTETHERLVVDIRDIYVGRTIQHKYTRRVICEKCNGNGTASGKPPPSCTHCGGRGKKVEMRQIGPGMVQQMMSPCNECLQTGKRINKSDVCKTCLGKRAIEKTDDLSINLRPGTPEGEKIKFSGLASYDPRNPKCKDHIFVISYKPDESFQFLKMPSGLHLSTTKTISLAESLTGFRLSFTHLDGTILNIRAPRGHVITPGDTLGLSGYGFPDKHGNHGTLFIVFNIVFPASYSFDGKQLRLIREAFDESDKPEREGDLMIDVFDKEDVLREMDVPQEEHEEGVQCHQQ